MYLIKNFHSKKIINFLNILPTYPIFSIGTGNAKQVSRFNKFYNPSDSFFSPLLPLYKFHLYNFNKYGVTVHSTQIYVENRDFIFDNTDFEGKLHMDSINDEGTSCYTAIYYYRFDNNIKGGKLLFPPFGEIQPKVNQVIYFDGDIKHKIGYTYGTGIRGTIIFSFMKT